MDSLGYKNEIIDTGKISTVFTECPGTVRWTARGCFLLLLLLFFLLISTVVKSVLLIAFIFGMFCKSGHYKVSNSVLRPLYSQKVWDHVKVVQRCIRYAGTYIDSVSPSLLGQVPWQQNSWLPKQLWTTECTRYLQVSLCLIGFRLEEMHRDI